MSKAFQGSCLCGEVNYEFDEFLPRVAHCHCSMCRKFHGAAFATIASVARSTFSWTKGKDSLQEYRAENGTVRTFCKHCGSSLSFFSPRAAADVIEIALGSVDGEIPVKPDAHIFVSSGASWSVICDRLPRHKEGRDSGTISEN